MTKQRKTSQSQTRRRRKEGGRILVSNSKTLVFTLDELPALYPTATSAFLMNPKTGAVSVDLANMAMCRDSPEQRLGAEIIVKHPKVEEDREADEKYNELVRHMFGGKLNALSITSLHPTYSRLVVEYVDASAARRRTDTMTVYRRFNTDLGSWNQCDTKTLLSVAHAVLMFVMLLHNHSHVHMDIKPGNILCNVEDDKNPEFVLTDYGMVYHMNDVFGEIGSRAAGGLEEEFDVGTNGFKSPLLRKAGEDSDNRVFPVFTAVARGDPGLGAKVREAEETGKETEFWGSYFTAKRKSVLRGPQDVAKVDLQSLGITLAHLLPRHLCTPSSSSSPPTDRYAIEIIRRLMLCETDSFYSASAAVIFMMSSGLLLEVPRR